MPPAGHKDVLEGADGRSAASFSLVPPPLRARPIQCRVCGYCNRFALSKGENPWLFVQKMFRWVCWEFLVFRPLSPVAAVFRSLSAACPLRHLRGGSLVAACPLSHRCAMPAPPKGEPLASRATFRWTHKARQGAKERASLTGAAASGQEHLVKLLWSQTAGHYCFRAAQALLVPREPDRHASASPYGRGVTEGDGEGKDATGETLAQRQHRSDKEPAYRCAAALTQAACPLSHRCAMPALPKGEP